MPPRDSFLFLILAILTSAFLLEKRGEPSFSALYLLHLTTLTLFQLLAPFIVAAACNRARPLVTALATLVLMAVMVDGTYKDAEPVVQYFQEAQAYTPGLLPPGGYVAPVEILPPTSQPVRPQPETIQPIAGPTLGRRHSAPPH